MRMFCFVFNSEVISSSHRPEGLPQTQETEIFQHIPETKKKQKKTFRNLSQFYRISGVDKFKKKTINIQINLSK